MRITRVEVQTTLSIRIKDKDWILRIRIQDRVTWTQVWVKTESTWVHVESLGPKVMQFVLQVFYIIAQSFDDL